MISEAVLGDRYRFGFNGMEKQDEIKSLPYDFENRLYDSRRGQFPTLDRLADKFPNQSPYVFAANTPIQAIDLDGLEAWVVTFDHFYNKSGKEIETKTSWYLDIELKNINRVYEVHKHHPIGYTSQTTKGYESARWTSVPFEAYPQQFPNKGNVDRSRFSIKGYYNFLYGEAAIKYSKLVSIELGFKGILSGGEFILDEGFEYQTHGSDIDNFTPGGGFSIGNLNVGYRREFKSSESKFGKEVFSSSIIEKKYDAIGMETSNEGIKLGVPNVKLAFGVGVEGGIFFEIRENLSSFEKQLKKATESKPKITKSSPDL